MITLQQGLDEMSLGVSETQVEKLQGYCDLVRKWNKSFNLVSHQDIDRLVSRHVLDSLTAVHLIEGDVVLDFGTGAGFPGIPLAIVQPDMRFDLCDRLNRRTRFLHQVVNQLKLDNVEILASDIKTLPDSQQYSTVVCRAVATADRVWDMVAPKLASRGSLLLYQSTQQQSMDEPTVKTAAERKHDEKTTANRSENSGNIEKTEHVFEIPGLDHTHTILQITRAAGRHGL